MDSFREPVSEINNPFKNSLDDLKDLLPEKPTAIKSVNGCDRHPNIESGKTKDVAPVQPLPIGPLKDQSHSGRAVS
jgi:hypothetical protein